MTTACFLHDEVDDDRLMGRELKWLERSLAKESEPMTAGRRRDEGIEVTDHGVTHKSRSP